MSWPVAYVMDSDPQALSVVRDLGRHGIPVVTLTSKPHSPGRFSRYATAQVLPRIDEHPQSWLEHLLREGKRQSQRSVLFPCTDRFVEFVATHRQQLETWYAIPLPSNDILATILDKRRQYRLAEQVGIPLPRTVYPESEDDVADLRNGRWSYPCVLKPATPHQWIQAYRDGSKLLMAHSPEELVDGYRNARQRGLQVLIQECIPGGDELIYSLYCYANANGELLGSGVGRKLRQFPVGVGNGTLRESVLEPRVVELGRDFIHAIGFHGIGNVEFRRDPRDGEFKLMELNTRTALGEEVLIAGGLHLPYLAYRDLIGQPLPPQDQYRVGLKWWYCEMDLRAFKEYRRRGELTLWRWLRSLIGVKAFAHFAWDDVRPFVVAMRTMVWKWRRGLL